MRSVDWLGMAWGVLVVVYYLRSWLLLLGGLVVGLALGLAVGARV